MSEKLISFINRKDITDFPKKYIPTIVETTDGYFIEPVETIVDVYNSVNMYVRFLLLNKDFNPVNGHDYPFVKIPTEGYLMRISLIHKNETELSKDFIIDYIVNINNINVISSIQKIDKTDNIASYDDISTQVTKAFENINDAEYSDKLMRLISDKGTFFEKYLSRII